LPLVSYPVVGDAGVVDISRPEQNNGKGFLYESGAGVHQGPGVASLQAESVPSRASLHHPAVLKERNAVFLAVPVDGFGSTFC
jgi:hypothetical protein